MLRPDVKMGGANMGEAGKTLYLAVIGMGGRGMGLMNILLHMPDVKVRVVCDKYRDRMLKAQDAAEALQGFRPDGETDYKSAVNRSDIDAVMVFTDWVTHIPIAVEAMRAGKPVGMEVSAAASVSECWKLVRTSEETGVGCMMLENCCYNSTEMSLLRMVREGVFGEIVHCQGGYEHDLRDQVGKGDIERHYRQDHFMRRNCELYPTHEMGPIAKYLNINRGNRMLSLVSMSSKAAGMSAWMQAHRPDDPIAKARFNEGDIVTTMIKCANGETILLTNDGTLPRPYSRGGRLQGTKGIWMEDSRSIYIENGLTDPADPDSAPITPHKWTSANKWIQAYKHPLWVEYEAFRDRGGQVGENYDGHGGMDYLVLRAFIEAVQDNKPFPIDVYDAASWICISALSEESIAMGSLPVPIPDFTDGKWIYRKGESSGRYSLD